MNLLEVNELDVVKLKDGTQGTVLLVNKKTGDLLLDVAVDLENLEWKEVNALASDVSEIVWKALGK